MFARLALPLIVEGMHPWKETPLSGAAEANPKGVRGFSETGRETGESVFVKKFLEKNLVREQALNVQDDIAALDPKPTLHPRQSRLYPSDYRTPCAAHSATISR